MKQTYTVESVTSGHPDKICDQISDAVLDAYLAQDPYARVAIETFGSHGLLVIGGEVTSRGEVEAGDLASNLYRQIGYDDSLKIITNIVRQSPDIAQGVDTGGAGDQGCLKKGTLVRTRRGFVPIEEVQIGDFVATPIGWRRVRQTKMTGRKKIVEIICINGMTLECTPDHRVFCYGRHGSTYWKQAISLGEGDFIAILKPHKMSSDSYMRSSVLRHSFFGRYNHKVFGPEVLHLNQDVGYLTGELIGDGYVANSRLLEIAFGNNVEHAVTVQRICDQYMPHQWRLLRSNDGNVSLKVDSLIVRKHFEQFGLSYDLAPYKKTPQAVFTSPRETIVAYLRGLFDSDGTIVEKTGRGRCNIKVRLGSSSLKLLRETQLLLNDFGIKSSILCNSFRGAPVGKKGRRGQIYHAKYDSYVLSLVGFDSYQTFCREIGFIDRKKQERVLAYVENVKVKPPHSRSVFLIPHPNKDELIDEKRLGSELPFALTKFRELIDKNEEADVYDLEIEDVHVFSGNGIFVHNSMFGYAIDETPELLPRAVVLVHKLTQELEKLRRNDPECSWLRPDGKAQVTMENGRVKTVLVSCQHSDEISQAEIRGLLIKKLIAPVVVDIKGVEILVNPTGKFVVGGFTADTGLTGRKIIADTYGGLIPHGGGCFSGKDPTKVDRSAAYMARFVAKNIVANGLAKECLVSVAYAIGRAEPLMVHAETEKGEDFSDLVQKKFDFRPKAIIERLNLRRPIYIQTAAYGHFGKPGLPWEEIVKL